jgi:hypothetical protein
LTSSIAMQICDNKSTYPETSLTISLTKAVRLLK